MPEVSPIRDLKAYLEPERVERLILVASNPRDKLLVRIPWRTGIRVTEMVKLEEPDIDYANRTIAIVIQKKRKKDDKVTERRRFVPIDKETLDMIKHYLRWRKQYGYDGTKLFPLTRQRVNQIFWKLAQKAGIKQVGDSRISKHLNMHPHILRHSFAIHCIKNGMAIPELQKILGHQSVNTTMVYLQFSAADLHTSYDKIWESPGGVNSATEETSTTVRS